MTCNGAARGFTATGRFVFFSLLLAAPAGAQDWYAAPPAQVAVPEASKPVAAAAEGCPALKSRTASFTSKWCVKAEGGKIYIRPNGGPGAWEELPAPEADGALAELSADGDNLMAVSYPGRIYYMKFSGRKWSAKIGKPLGGKIYLPPNRGWAVSHLGGETGWGYEDPDGKFIQNKQGVSTLYALSADGLRLSYIDPWLQPGFDYHIDMPERGRFEAVNISASASTIFLIGAGGRMFTRLADFDTLGCDPLFEYSFLPADKPGVIRLPGENWREQPRVPGRATRNITILQTGRGNAARELRVEGADAEGRGGYFFKPIYAAAWSFAPTDLPVNGPFLDGEGIEGPSIDADYKLDYRRLPDGSYLRGFSPLNRRAELVVPGVPEPLVFHTRETFLPNKAGHAWRLFGTIEIPAAMLPYAEKGGPLAGLGGNYRETWAKVKDGKVRLHDNLLDGLGEHTSGLFQDYGER